MGKSGPSRAGAFRWARILTESSTPVFLLDAKRRLLLFNPGCEAWTGWPADDLLGLTCDFVTEPDVHSREAVLAACAAPAEVWQGQLAELPLFLPHRSEAPRPVRIRFQPVENADEHVTLVLGFVFNVTEPAPSPAPTLAQTLHAELAALRHEVRSRYGEDTIIARSAPMRRVLTQLAVATQSSAAVLFHGERGTGRHHLARLLHARGPLARQSFVPVDCRHTESTELKRILKQLKNDVRGQDILQAGTLFLHDIAAAPRDVQERLAQWLAAPSTKTSPRILTSTDQSLEQLVDRDQFHRELFYLLTPMAIEVPPLRHRAEDMLPLAQYFLEEGNRFAERQLTGFSPEAAESLRRYPWPGNLAELREVVRSAAAQAQPPVVMETDFPLSFRAGQDAQRLGPPPAAPLQPLEAVLENVERDHVQAALKASRDNLSKAAELLGMSRPKLYRRLEALGLMADRPPEE